MTHNAESEASLPGDDVVGEIRAYLAEYDGIATEDAYDKMRRSWGARLWDAVAHIRTLLSRDAAHTARIAELEAERDRLREALERKGKAQIWRDGFISALDTVKSYRTSAPPPPSWAHARDEFADILQRSANSQAAALNTGGGE